MINGALLIAPIKKKYAFLILGNRKNSFQEKKMSNFKQGAVARYNMIWSNDLISTVDTDF